MALRNVRPALERTSRVLEKTQDSREFLLRNTREIVILCSRSIIATHRGDIRTGKRNLRDAGALIKKFKKRATGDLKRYLVTPEQEFVEAAALIAVAEKREIPSERALAVTPESYVQGLLDCVGELKRMTFDRIRTGSVDEAARIFDIMEGLYLSLYTFSMYDKVLKEARRKIDVNRILVEDVRAAITEEKRRTELVRALRDIRK